MPGFYFKQNTRSTKLFKCFFKTHIKQSKQSQQQQQPMGGGETLSNCGITWADDIEQPLNMSESLYYSVMQLKIPC